MKSASIRRPLFLLTLMLLLSAPAGAACAAEGDIATDRARKSAVKGLKKKIRKLANSPYREKPGKKAEIIKHLEAVSALGGVEAGLAALEALHHPDKEIRDTAMGIVEREHDKAQLKPLIALLEDDKKLRKDADARRRIAHALSVVADPGAVEPLADLIRFDEDPEVVAEAADALAGYAAAPLAKRKEAVRRLVDLYESTWNLKESVKTGQRDKILRKEAQKKYKVYGKSLRYALQSLVGIQLTRPQEWREWWNENKKKNKWKRTG
jgi:HEAT repeat protein